MKSMTASGETTYVALLRGINVGRAKPVAMADSARSSRRPASAGSGRSCGAATSCAGRAAPDEVSRRLETAIEKRLRLDVRVVVRTAAELEAVISANPIPEAASEGSSLHVMFLAKPLSAGERARSRRPTSAPTWSGSPGREIYVWYRHGMSGSDTATRLGRRSRRP